MSRHSLVILTLVTLLATPVAFGQRTRTQTPSERDAIRANETAAALQANLKDARRLLSNIRDQRTREQLEVLLSRAALQADDLRELLGGVAGDQLQRPIADADFAKLLDNIKDQSFDDDKVEFIKTFVKGRALRCEQAKSILKTMSFDEGRMQVAIMLHPTITDPENFFEVLKIFPFESSRKKVMEAIRKN